MGKQAAAAGSARKRCRPGCRACRPRVGVKWCCKFVQYYIVATLFNLRNVWNWTYEPEGFQCNHPKLPVNNSGIKVLVYAPAKTGTTQLTRVLLNFYRNAYHSEDFNMHIWAPLADDYYRKPENGGRMYPWARLATPAPPAYTGGSFWPRKQPHISSDFRVMNNTPREVLAERLSMCNVDTMVFDGIEQLFWDVYAVSPDAKIIMLNWRTFDEWKESANKFSLLAVIELMGINTLNVGMHVLPYNALVLSTWDLLTGGTLQHRMNNGTPAVLCTGPKFLLFQHSFTERRFCQHFYSGFGMMFNTAEEYDGFWAEGFRRIPKERRLEFSMRNGTMRQLCDFLGIEGDWRCDTGKLPNNETIFAAHETDHPQDFFFLMPYYFLCHWCSYNVLYMAVAWPVGFVLGKLGLSQVSKRRKRKSN